MIYDTGVTLAETWQALERLVDDGRCKSIGLSDISLEKVQEIVKAARIKPAVVQVEAHPYLPEWELLDFCRQQGIVLLAFAALGHGMEPKLVENPVITGIRENFEVSTLPDDAMQEIRDGITTRVRLNPVVETGVPGFIPQNR